MKELFISSYCYGKLGLDVEKMILTAKEQGFQGVELLCPITPEIAKVLRRENMKVADSTVLPDYNDLAEVDLLHRLGISYLQAQTRFGDREQTLRAAELLDELGRQARSHGFKVFYHNHTHEWRRSGDGTLMDILMDNTDPENVCMQMDAGWAVCAGIDPEEFIRRHPGRVELMHVKASTGKLGPEGVGFMAPAPGEPVMLGMAGPPTPEPAPENTRPAAPPPAMRAAMEKIRSVSGTMEDCVWNYESLMNTAEAYGCKAFILERDEFYLPDVLDVMAEDLKTLRKFW